MLPTRQAFTDEEMSAVRPTSCRFAAKRTFSSRSSAGEGAEFIRAKVESAGGDYTQLHPYLCPDADHWHLSHYPQGTATCPDCGGRAPAWNGGQRWVISAHTVDGVACVGEGARAERGEAA